MRSLQVVVYLVVLTLANFTQSLHHGLGIFEQCKLQHVQYTNFTKPAFLYSGAQPGLHFGGGQFS